MIFEHSVKRKNIWGNFIEAYKNNKIPNAYILFGDEGVGKEALSVELAGLLNCKRPINNLNACGGCRSCISIKSFQHEDIHFIHPLPAKKNNSKSNYIDPKIIDELKSNYNEKIKNPYHKIRIENANTISINSIRELKKKLFLSKSDENWSVVIIFDAERLCIPKSEPANALLKILEEPPNKTLFILITSKMNLIIPTIQSRCQKIFFPNLSKEDIRNYAKEYDYEIEEDALQMADGSISNFIDIVNNQMTNEINTLLQSFYRKSIDSFEDILSFFNKIKSKDKIYIYLNYLVIATKDIYLLSLNKSSTKIHYTFLYEIYNQILTASPNGDWVRIIGAINQCSLDINRNINLSISIYNMLINVQYCLEGKSIDRFKSNLIKEL